MTKQLERLKHALCQRGYCQAQDLDVEHRSKRYRLPYCAAFLRPTDKLQKDDSRFVSSGYHVPICVIERNWQGNPQMRKRITSKQIRDEAVTHKVFEELFNVNMLGSRFIEFEELERLYREIDAHT